MKDNRRSEKNALLMLDRYIRRVEHDLGDEVVHAIVLVGSLSSGSYVPGPGADIDQITILHDSQPKSALESVERLLSEVEVATGFGIPFARTIYRMTDLMRPFNTDFQSIRNSRRHLEVPVELLRIHESGKVVWGNSDILDQLPIPTREEFLAFDRLARRASQENKDERSLRGLPPRISAQVILTNAFRHYFYATGESCSNKLKIWEKMKSRVPQYRYLRALELSTILKRSLAQDEESLTHEDIRDLLSEAESLMRWQSQHDVSDVPVNNPDTSCLNAGAG